MSQLLTEIESTKKVLLEVIAGFTNDNIDTIPFEGSWTGGQVMEHLSKSVSPTILYGGTKSAERAPDEKLPMLRSVFLNYEKQFQSPGFILPTETKHDQQVYLDDFTHKFDALLDAAKTLDLNELCTDFEMPRAGNLTRLEVLYFFAWHSQRHTKQLERISAAVKTI